MWSLAQSVCILRCEQPLNLGVSISSPPPGTTVDFSGLGSPQESSQLEEPWTGLLGSEDALQFTLAWQQKGKLHEAHRHVGVHWIVGVVVNDRGSFSKMPTTPNESSVATLVRWKCGLLATRVGEASRPGPGGHFWEQPSWKHTSLVIGPPTSRMSMPAGPVQLLHRTLLHLRSRLLLLAQHPVVWLLWTPHSLLSPSGPVPNCPDHCPISSRGWSHERALRPPSRRVLGMVTSPLIGSRGLGTGSAKYAIGSSHLGSAVDAHRADQHSSRNSLCHHQDVPFLKTMPAACTGLSTRTRLRSSIPFEALD